jgi:hypothetical protein
MRIFPIINDSLNPALTIFSNPYNQTPKEILLERLDDASDIELLCEMSQENLAFLYAERCTYSVLNSAGNY